MMEGVRRLSAMNTTAIVGSKAVLATSSALVTLPTTAIVAAQPYSTLSGYGLSLNLADSSIGQRSSAVALSSSSSSLSLRALHALPFTNALVPASYQHMAFEALTEFCTSVRPDTNTTPMPDIWERLGDISTSYATMGYAPRFGQNGESAIQRRMRILKARLSGQEEAAGIKEANHLSAAHPLLAGVELVPSEKGTKASINNRGSAFVAGTPASKLDVKVSLYDAHHRPIYTALMTATNNHHSPISTTSDAEDRSSLMRADFQAADLSVSNGGKGSGWFALASLVGRRGPEMSDFVPSRAIDSIFRLSSGNEADPGHESRIHFSQLASVPASALGSEAAHQPIPPWILLPMITEFAENLINSEKDLIANNPSRNTQLVAAADAAASMLFSDLLSHAAGTDHSTLALVSHNSSLTNDLVTDTPMEFICSQPLYFLSYHMPPWQQRVGLPSLRGEECISFYAEIWQDGRRCMRGTFFFSSS